MARFSFVLLLAFSLTLGVVARAGPVDRLASDPGLTATARPAAAPGPSTHLQSGCHGHAASLQHDPHELLLRVATAALRVVAQMLQLPGWPGGQSGHESLWSDDLRASIDALWLCLTEASRTTGGWRGDRQ